jgi:hypothetical protein
VRRSEELVELGDIGGQGPRQRHGIAAARRPVLQRDARPVIGADAGNRATAGRTSGLCEPGSRTLQMSAPLKAPDSRITVGLPLPRHSR